MKNILFFLLLTSVACYGQNPPASIEIHTSFGKPVLREKVNSAVKFDDLIPYYPHNWIDGYLGTMVTIKHNKAIRTSDGKNNSLTATQKSLLNVAEVGDELTLIIKYFSKNSVTGNNDHQEIKLEYTVVSELEAKPASGIEKMREYFRTATFKSFEDGTGESFAGASVLFKVDEYGHIAEASLSKSSGNMAADQRLLKSVRSMPVWTPAQDKSGKKYSREFILEVIKSGC